jgi:hypothetical protein
MTAQEKREENKRRATLINELRELQLKRANARKKDLLEVALAAFSAHNLDLLTPAERKKYKSVIAADQ